MVFINCANDKTPIPSILIPSNSHVSMLHLSKSFQLLRIPATTAFSPTTRKGHQSVIQYRSEHDSLGPQRVYAPRLATQKKNEPSARTEPTEPPPRRQYRRRSPLRRSYQPTLTAVHAQRSFPTAATSGSIYIRRARAPPRLYICVHIHVCIYCSSWTLPRLARRP